MTSRGCGRKWFFRQRQEGRGPVHRSAAFDKPVQALLDHKIEVSPTCGPTRGHRAHRERAEPTRLELSAMRGVHPSSGHVSGEWRRRNTETRDGPGHTVARGGVDGERLHDCHPFQDSGSWSGRPRLALLQAMGTAVPAATHFSRKPLDRLKWSCDQRFHRMSGRSPWTSARTSEPNFCTFDAPIPEMPTNALSSVGRCSAMAVSVASVNTT